MLLTVFLSNWFLSLFRKLKKKEILKKSTAYLSLHPKETSSCYLHKNHSFISVQISFDK